MASVKNLKKDINHTLGDLIGEVDLWGLENPSSDMSESDKLKDEIIVVFDELISKVHQKEVVNKKAHFKLVSKELEERAGKIAEKINNL